MPVDQQTLPLQLTSSVHETRVDAVAKSAARTVNDLQIGESAVIGAPSSLDATIVRLMEMGMTAGVEVTLTRRALGGDPIEISLRGTRLCLRRADAARFALARARETASQG